MAPAIRLLVMMQCPPSARTWLRTWKSACSGLSPAAASSSTSLAPGGGVDLHRAPPFPSLARRSWRSTRARDGSCRNPADRRGPRRNPASRGQLSMISTASALARETMRSSRSCAGSTGSSSGNWLGPATGGGRRHDGALLRRRAVAVISRAERSSAPRTAAWPNDRDKVRFPGTARPAKRTMTPMTAAVGNRDQQAGEAEQRAENRSVKT